MMPPALSRRRAWILAFVATSTMSISYIDRQTLSVLAPRVTADLGISDFGYGWLASAFSFAYLIGAPISGRFVDRIGARRGLLGAVLVWSVVSAAHAFAPGFAALFALRIALGLAESPSFPGAAQAVHRVLPPSERARGLGVLFTGSSIGAMIAPPVAIAIEVRFGWRAAFIGTAIVGLIWVPVWLRVAFEPSMRRVLDHTGGPSIVSVDGAAPYRPQPVLVPETRPRIREIIAHPAVLRAVVLVLGSAPILAFMLLWGSKYLVRQYNMPMQSVAALLWFPPLLFDVGAVAFGDLASRRAVARNHDGAPDRLLVTCATLLLLCAAAMPFAPTAVGSIAIGGLVMAGGGGIYALITSDMLSRVPPNAVSMAGGMTAAAQSLAYIVANPLIGRSVGATGTFAPVVVALALWVLPGWLIWILWPPPPLDASARGQPAVTATSAE